MDFYHQLLVSVEVVGWTELPQGSANLENTNVAWSLEYGGLSKFNGDDTKPSFISSWAIYLPMGVTQLWPHFGPRVKYKAA